MFPCSLQTLLSVCHLKTFQSSLFIVYSLICSVLESVFFFNIVVPLSHMYGVIEDHDPAPLLLLFASSCYSWFIYFFSFLVFTLDSRSRLHKHMCFLTHFSLSSYSMHSTLVRFFWFCPSVLLYSTSYLLYPNILY